MTPDSQAERNLDEVLDWIESRLEIERSAEIEALVAAGDPEAEAAVEWAHRFLAAAARFTEPVPDDLARRLRTMWPNKWPKDSVTAPSWRERFPGFLNATVSFDSLLSPGLAMARSASDSTRQIVVSAPDIDVAVDLETSPAGSGIRAALQLLPLSEDAAVADVLVQAWTSTGLLESRHSDEIGRVEFTALPATVIVVDVDATVAWPAMHAELDLRRQA
jgi:hypothetical protein